MVLVRIAGRLMSAMVLPHAVESRGLANPHDKFVAFGVIPILELDPVTLRAL